MKNVTIILQGKILQESLDFLIKNYPTANVVISTWIGTDIDFSNLPQSYYLVVAPLPKKSGNHNLNYQLISTLNGLRMVETDYVIKLRGDEYYSNLEHIAYQICMNPDKVHCSPIFFRHWSFMEYHISDHIIAGTTSNIKLMFSQTKFNVDNKLLHYTKDNQKFDFWEPEINLTRSYLMSKEPNRWEQIDGRDLMIDNFKILDLEKLHPYKIVANIFKSNWTGGFIPEHNFSISNVNHLKLSKEDAYNVNRPQG